MLMAVPLYSSRLLSSNGKKRISYFVFYFLDFNLITSFLFFLLGISLTIKNGEKHTGRQKTK